MSAIKKLFSRKKKIPLACSISIENEPGHVHSGACFLDIQPLSVVELFQSQGCASCPPAIPKIHAAANNPNLLLLTYDVTYFDHMGWTDTFGNRQWDARQRAYVMKWGRKNIFTPQVIADGVADSTGADIDDIVSKARETRAQLPWHIIVDTNDAELRVDSDAGEVEAHDILLVMYDPKEEKVKVGKGENKGKKIVHRNVVKSFHKIGEWKGGNITVPLPEGAVAPHGGLQVVAMVQAGPGGPIIASQKL